MPIKRYGLGREYAASIGAPSITEQPDGTYVRHEDYAAAIAHNELLVLKLKKADEELEAIGAGGVSGKRITDDGTLGALQACERTYHQMMISGTPDNCHAHDKARAEFWRVFAALEA